MRENKEDEKKIDVVSVFCYTMNEKEFDEALKTCNDNIAGVIRKENLCFTSHVTEKGDGGECTTPVTATHMLKLLGDAYKMTRGELKSIEAGFPKFSERVEFRLSEDEIEKLEELVEFKGVSRSELLRGLIKDKHSETMPRLETMGIETYLETLKSGIFYRVGDNTENRKAFDDFKHAVFDILKDPEATGLNIWCDNGAFHINGDWQINLKQGDYTINDHLGRLDYAIENKTDLKEVAGNLLRGN